MAKSIERQVTERLGKMHKVASLTREALQNNCAHFARFVESKYGLENIQNLKPNHVEGYVRYMQERDLAAGTMANRLTAVRLIAEAINKPNIVARMNADYGIERDRCNPIEQNSEKVAEIRAELEIRAETSDKIAMMCASTAEMRDAFGLRAKESLMSHAVVNGHLRVEGAKGGRPRSLPMNTPERVAAVARVAAMAREFGNKHGRAIPTNLSLRQAYNQQRDTWSRLGGTKAEKAHMHSSRHNYSQERMEQGATREEISKELGHGREEVVSHYVH